MTRWTYASIAELQRSYERREVSPVEVLDATLARLESLEPRLNAVVSVLADAAHKQAAEAERAYLRGADVAPLTGVPVSVKDNIAVTGAAMTAGSRILRAHRPECDATVQRRLRRAGAVVFAKTNLLEFAYGFVHPDFGQANNPWDTERTAGGSSSGSASSLAAGIGYGSVVTDTGGSARLPAAFSGLVGLKPTFGIIDTSGVLPLAPSLDVVGILSRTTADSQVLLDVLVDATHGSGPGTMHGRSATPPRVGVIDNLLNEPFTDAVRSAFDTALEGLRRVGARVSRVRLPGVEQAAEHAATVMLVEAAHTHARWYPERAADYAAGTRANLHAGTRVNASTYLDALAQCRRFAAAVDNLLDSVDVLVCPTIGFTAPEREPDFEGGGLDYIARTIPFSATGHPAVTIPASHPDPGGLPVGLQFVAGRGQEHVLYQVAGIYETALGGFAHPPLIDTDPEPMNIGTASGEKGLL